MMPNILCYAELKRIKNLKGKTLRFDCTKFEGFYEPLEKLKNHKGEIKNPHYPNNVNDCMLFILHYSQNRATLSSIEIIILNGGALVHTSYRKPLKMGVLITFLIY